jgi:hypothetical protein
MRIDPDTCRDADLLAAEVRRLRAVIASATPTLTDAEREAVKWFACYGVDRPLGHSTTLRGLLERLAR